MSRSDAADLMDASTLASMTSKPFSRKYPIHSCQLGSEVVLGMVCQYNRVDMPDSLCEERGRILFTYSCLCSPLTLKNTSVVACRRRAAGETSLKSVELLDLTSTPSGVAFAFAPPPKPKREKGKLRARLAPAPAAARLNLLWDGYDVGRGRGRGRKADEDDAMRSCC